MKCQRFKRSFTILAIPGIALALTLLGRSVSASQPVNLVALTEIVCSKESRTVQTPERAVRHRIKRDAQGNIIRASTDLGFCQINVRMLEDMGFLASLGRAAYRDAKLIFDKAGSKSIALEIFAQRAADFPGVGVRCLYVKYRWGKQTKCTRELLNDVDVMEVGELYNKKLLAMR